jgi:hypothetical protein
VNGFISGSLHNEIRCTAARLADFVHEKRSLGTAVAAKRLEAWCGNFAPFLSSCRALEEVVRNLEFIPDRRVLDECVAYLRRNAPGQSWRPVFTCLGETSESSSRIMGLMKGDDDYAEHVTQAVTRCIRGQADTIVTIDDFLNTGNQFCQVLRQLFDDLPAEAGAVRAMLPQEDIRHLKERQTGFRFCFYLGTETGRDKANAELRRLGLNGQVTVLRQYSDDHGMFGGRGDVPTLEGNPDAWAATDSAQESIFRHTPPEEVRQFVRVARAVGEQLLRAAKPGWPDGKLADRVLGYGNSAQLFITQKNVPTPTLTCLWRGGQVSIDGVAVDWAPLLGRREKGIGGHEGDAGAPGTTPAPSGPASCMEQFRLDFARGKSTPLELVLLYPAACRPLSAAWHDGTADYLTRADPLREALDTGASSGFRVRRLAPVFTARFQNRASLNVDGANGKGSLNLPVKIHGVDLFCREGVPALAGLRLRADPSAPASRWSLVELQQCFRQLAVPGGEGQVRFRYKTRRDSASGREFTEAAIPTVLGELLRPACEPGTLALPRAAPRLFAFVRAGAGLFRGEPSGNAERQARALASLRGKALPRLPVMHLDEDCVIALSERAGVMLAGSGPAVNAGGWHGIFLTEYLLAYLLVLLYVAGGERTDSAVARQLQRHGRPWFVDDHHWQKFAGNCMAMFAEVERAE